jgi:hypothetical protein
MPPPIPSFSAHAETRISRDCHLAFITYTLSAPTKASAQPGGDEATELSCQEEEPSCMNPLRLHIFYDRVMYYNNERAGE